MVIFTNREKGLYNVVGAVILQRFYVSAERPQKTKVTGLWEQTQPPLGLHQPGDGLPAVVMAIVPALMTTFVAPFMSALMAMLFTIPVAVPAGVH